MSFLSPIIFGLLIILTGASLADTKEGFSVDPESLSAEEKAEVVEHLEVIAAGINEKSPVMIDKWVRLDRATVGPGAQLNYFYTIPELLRAKAEADLPRLAKIW